MVFVYAAVLSVGLQILLALGGGWVSAHVKAVDPEVYISKLNQFTVKILCPCLGIWVLGIKTAMRDPEIWQVIGVFALWNTLIQIICAIYVRIFEKDFIAGYAIYSTALAYNNTGIIGPVMAEAVLGGSMVSLGLVISIPMFLQQVSLMLLCFEAHKMREARSTSPPPLDTPPATPSSPPALTPADVAIDIPIGTPPSGAYTLRPHHPPPLHIPSSLNSKDPYSKSHLDNNNTTEAAGAMPPSPFAPKLPSHTFDPTHTFPTLNSSNHSAIKTALNPLTPSPSSLTIVSTTSTPYPPLSTSSSPSTTSPDSPTTTQSHPSEHYPHPLPPPLIPYHTTTTTTPSGSGPHDSTNPPGMSGMPTCEEMQRESNAGGALSGLANGTGVLATGGVEGSLHRSVEIPQAADSKGGGVSEASPPNSVACGGTRGEGAVEEPKSFHQCSDVVRAQDKSQETTTSQSCSNNEHPPHPPAISMINHSSHCSKISHPDQHTFALPSPSATSTNHSDVTPRHSKHHHPHHTHKPLQPHHHTHHILPQLCSAPRTQSTRLRRMASAIFGPSDHTEADKRLRGTPGLLPPRARQLVSIVFLNPLMVSTFIGIVISLLGLNHYLNPDDKQFVWQIGCIEGTLRWFARAVPPLAIFTQGLWVYNKVSWRTIRANLRGSGKVALFLVLRLTVMPLSMGVLAKYCGLSDRYCVGLLVMTAIPPGQLAFVFAEQYNVGAGFFSALMIIGLFIMLPHTIVILDILKRFELFEWSVIP